MFGKYKFRSEEGKRISMMNDTVKSEKKKKKKKRVYNKPGNDGRSRKAEQWLYKNL